MSGCRPAPPPENLPTYDWVDEATAIKVLAERSKAVHTTSAEVGVTLTKPDGQSVQFDGAMATRPPDALRLQTFKFGRTVFDLTLNPQGMFVKTMDDPARKDKIIPASQSAARFAREWATFTGGLFEEQGLAVQTSASQLIVRRTLADGRTVVCQVDRPTLTPRRYGLLDAAGVERFSLDVSGYRTFNGILHPTRLLARSEQGTIDIELRDLEINGDQPERAFVPPADAELLK
ncbi:hypothetical protein [Humisphaera borealis]|uniref:Uncharacterized protein n=1 Tax=Humisphaera borealis TaxID=2807512 RepID=A0A7M2WQB9_9BACT|nr:hypothetical protein [Humisphaera borealis]QOV87688.1 hypothetical protein IPV69_15490 [Humisphaera borealis]